jgi:hypothetical protein
MFISLQYYSQFFDVDTSTVLMRCRAALFPRANFLDLLDGNPDLYGPFWIATTVVAILFLSGTISWKLTGNAGKESDGKTWGAYDWGLLSGAAGLIYGYTCKRTNSLQVGLGWRSTKFFASCDTDHPLLHPPLPSSDEHNSPRAPYPVWLQQLDLDLRRSD